MAKDSELPSDEEELAVQLKQAYHDQQALDEKDQIKRLKERFIQVEIDIFRWCKYFNTRNKGTPRLVVRFRERFGNSIDFFNVFFFNN